MAGLTEHSAMHRFKLSVCAAAAVALGGCNSESEPSTNVGDTPLTNPALANETAPDTFTVQFETTKGPVVIDVTRAWAPRGADRFYNLVKAGYYNDVAFFRVISGFMAQFGISGDPRLNQIWRDARIQDDPVTQSNTRGMMTFATSGPNTRTTQLFINFGDNARLDG
ncbi:MAG: peptidylprolyl isomerase, partial [Myxococcota bacterium]